MLVTGFDLLCCKGQKLHVVDHPIVILIKQALKVNYLRLGGQAIAGFEHPVEAHG